VKVAIQGERGAFSDLAAQSLLPRARIVPLPTFADIFAALERRSVHRALVPIENTLAGSVGENYDRLRRSPAVIVAETVLRVQHNLIAAPGTRRRDLRRVLSHPVALQQCLRFLQARPALRAEPFYDTAGSVKHIVAERMRDTAAIASTLAARIYGGRILAREIEDDKQNFTRFFLLSLEPRWSRDANKISVVFNTRNVPGALFKCLSVFALREISLSRIESRPVPGTPWEYSFYVDFSGRLKEPNTENALRHLAEITDFMRILGFYRAAKTKNMPKNQ
jgi:prephenate dehydratase